MDNGQLYQKKNIVQTLNEKLKSRWYLRILIYQVLGIKNEKQQKAISELSNIRSGGMWDKHGRMRWLCIVQVVKMGFWGESSFTIFQVFKSRKYRIRWLIAKKKHGSHIKLQYIVLKEILFLRYRLNEKQTKSESVNKQSQVHCRGREGRLGDSLLVRRSVKGWKQRTPHSL